ncbi:hypothetical protein [Bacillus sp. REN10]|uniref:hypothetical protein n=1 Tax=Bacillus sp. REN10 TaxID=2782541 RepID=UPI00193AFB06|nr:hypothetical protein [Bacillus sp. REN10]
MKDAAINIEKMTAEISLRENATYYVEDGHLVRVDDLPKGYGTQKIIWKDGKPKFFEIQYTSKGN